VRDILHRKIQHIIRSSGRRWHRGPYPRPIAEVSSGSAINITSEAIDDWAAMERLHTDEGCVGPKYYFEAVHSPTRRGALSLNPAYLLRKLRHRRPSRYFSDQ
jgi:hypothetical protein